MNILVISNGCFSLTDSNGRTLINLFNGFDKDNLAQIFTYGTPDLRYSNTFYQITDAQLLKAILRKESAGKVIVGNKGSKEEKDTDEPNRKQKKVKKTPFTMIAREWLWKISKVYNNRLKIWISDFRPDALFLFLGDNMFTIYLTLKIAREYHLPVYLYTTEDYVFKNYNYVTQRPSLFYSIFHAMLRKKYKAIFKLAKCGFFNTPMLARLYEETYRIPCQCIFNSSEVDTVSRPKVGAVPVISYLGNLGVGRCEAIADIADALGKISPNFKIDIYGKMPSNEKDAEIIQQNRNIRFMGFVPYEKVISIIHSSDLLIHTENSNDFYSKDLKYAFSTKIADSICSGTPLFVYAKPDIAVSDFIIQHDCAFLCSQKDQLNAALCVALQDESRRREILKNASSVSDEFLRGKARLIDFFNANGKTVRKLTQ